MNKLVTIGIPVFKRLQYLSHVLKLVESQDYPSIELVVSDNGQNGDKIQEIVGAHYSRPYRLRANAATATSPTHFNQLIQEASGEYFVLLADDDEISSNYVSELVNRLDCYPQATVAVSRQEIIDKDGILLRQSSGNIPNLVPGADFIRRTWQTCDLGYECFSTIFARTADLKACGGYPEFTSGSGIDNALLIKLCLNSNVAFSDKCVFRWRVDESSLGWSLRINDLAAAHKQFMRFLDTDPVIRELSAVHSAEWRELKMTLVKNEWQTYFWRWRDIYKDRLSGFEWVRAAFAMPFILPYRNVASVFRKEVKVLTKRLFVGHDPAAKEIGYFERDR